MLTEQDLRELVSFNADGGQVVSVYLNVDPSRHTPDSYKLRLRGLLKDLGDRVPPEDARAIEEYIEHQYDWSGRGLAMFSCAAQDYWRSYTLAMMVRSTAHVASKPYVKPLADLFDRYGHYAVVLVDKVGARLMHFVMGELVETSGTMGEEVRHVKRGMGSTAAGRRGGADNRAAGQHVDEVMAQNMKEVAEETERFCQAQSIRDLLIGGSEENVAMLRAQLPKALAEKVRGTFRAEMTAPSQEIRARSLEVMDKAEQEREAQLVDAIITAAAKGSNGVVRLDETLSAVHEGRVQTLAVAEGYHAPGYQCTGCGYITAQRHEQCLFCGQGFTEIPDAVESAIHQAISNGAAVEIVRDSSALERVGQIGALLRY